MNKRKQQSLICRALCSLLACLSVISGERVLQGGDQNQTSNPFTAPIKAARPRVFLGGEGFEGLTVTKLRQAMKHPEFAAMQRKWERKPLGRALLWMLSGRGEDREAAIAGLQELKAGQGSWSDRGPALVRLATLFDWLYTELDAETRKHIIERIEREADAAVDHIRRGRAPFFYSRTPGALAGVTIAGIALHGVSPKAKEYLELFRTWGVSDYFAAYDWVDGAATGASYTMNYTYVDLPQICAAWWSATGENPNEWIRGNQGDWLNDIVRFYLWSMRPSFAFTDINDLFRGIWRTHDEFCQGLDIASYVTRNGYGRAWAERWSARFGASLYHTYYAHNFIFRDVTLEPRPLDQLPHAALFGRDSCGYGFFRSDWPSPGEPDTATHVFFRCGDPMNVHGGVAAGEFQIFKYAPLASRGGRYQSYDSPPDQYHRNCISTNVVLFTNPDDPEDRGDQHTRRGLKHDHATWDQWLAIRERYGHDVATILEWEESEGIARCRADLTRANGSKKCRRWIREFIWLEDRHLIVADFVHTARPEIECRWQLHVPAKPTLGERLIQVTNQAPDLDWAEPSLKPSAREGRLFCQTLAPEQYTVVLHVDDKAEAFRPDGRSRGSVSGNAFHKRFGGHVIQIDPGDASQGVLVLNVLTAVSVDHKTPPQATHERVGTGEIEVNVDGAAVKLRLLEETVRDEQ